MEKNKTLSAGFNICGNDTESFVKEVEALEERTKSQIVDLERYEVVSLIKEDTEHLYVHIYKADGTLTKASILKARFVSDHGKSLADEFSSIKICLRKDGVIYPISRKAVSGMLTLLGFGGYTIFDDRFSIRRNGDIAWGFANLDKRATFILRQEADTSKVFCVASDKYTYIPLTVMNDVLTKMSTMGTLKCFSWNINHDIAQIYLDLPDKADEVAASYSLPNKIVPGIMLVNSSTGCSSVTVRATARIGSSVIPIGICKRKHQGTIDTDAFLLEVEKKVFTEVLVIPDKLCDLIKVSVEPKAALKKAFANIDMVDCIGKKNRDKVFEELSEEFNPSLPYTAYDIAIMCLQMPERIKSSIKEDAYKKVTDNVVNCLFCDYTDSSVEEEKRLLTI